jgi:poly(A) polymerase
LLANIPSARLFDEYRKLFLAGNSFTAFNLLCKYQLFGILFPKTAEHLDIHSNSNNYQFNLKFITLALKNTDDRVMEAKNISPGFILAVLLWQPLLQETQHLIAKGVPEVPAFYDAMHMVLSAQQRIIAFPKITTLMVKDIWILQERLKNLQGKRAIKTFNAPKFRAAYDFLMLRAEAEDASAIELATWWTKYNHCSDKERFLMTKNPKRSKAKHSKNPESKNLHNSYTESNNSNDNDTE